MNQTIKCTFFAVKCTFLIVCWLGWGIQTLPYPGLGEDCLPPHIWLAFVVTPCWDFCKHPSIKSRYSARKLGKFIRQTVAFVLKLPQNQEADVFDKKQVRVRDFNLLSLVSAMTRDVQTAHLFMRSLKDIASFKDSCKRSLIVCTCQVEVHWSISEIRSHKHLEVLAWFPNDCSCFVMFYPLSPSFMFP